MFWGFKNQKQINIFRENHFHKIFEDFFFWTHSGRETSTLRAELASVISYLESFLMFADLSRASENIWL